MKISDMHKKWMESPTYRKGYFREELADALANARRKAKLTQSELARKMGTTQSRVAQLEGKKGRPTTTTLLRWAQATGTILEIKLK